MKNIFKLTAVLAGCAALGAGFGPAARATDLLIDQLDEVANAGGAATVDKGTVDTGTQFGRTARAVNPAQTWIDSETTYSGVANPTVQYNYESFTFAAGTLGNQPFIQLAVDDPGAGDVFVSAYAGSYDPGDPSKNWLGDEGSSGNYGFYSFGPFYDPSYFNVVVPAGENLVVVVNTTDAAGVGLTEDFGLTVQSFNDVEYTDEFGPAAVPEPSTWAILGLGAAAGVAVLKRRPRKGVA